MGFDTNAKWKNSLDRGITALNIKTSSSLTRVRIKTHLGTLQDEIRELKYTVGDLVYEQWQCGRNETAAALPMLQQIKEKHEEMAQLHRQMLDLDVQERKILGENGKRSADAAPAQILCRRCGAACSTDANFCRSCGEKLSG